MYRVREKLAFLSTADKGTKLLRKGLEMYVLVLFDFIHLSFIFVYLDTRDKERDVLREVTEY